MNIKINRSGLKVSDTKFYNFKMSCKVNTEITGGYGDREENNESLNPEDLEQSVIMDMQDDNDRYKLYIHIIINTYQNLFSYLYCFPRSFCHKSKFSNPYIFET